MTTKKSFPSWAAIGRFFLALYIGVTIGFFVRAYAHLSGDLEECSAEIEELNKTIDSHCTDTELRLLSCDGRIDGCFCSSPVIKSPLDLEK